MRLGKLWKRLIPSHDLEKGSDLRLARRYGWKIRIVLLVLRKQQTAIVIWAIASVALLLGAISKLLSVVEAGAILAIATLLMLVYVFILAPRSLKNI
jgi:hypothetical protein